MPKKRNGWEKQEEKILTQFLTDSEILKAWDLKPVKIKKIGHDYKVKSARGEKMLKVGYQEDRIHFMYHALEHLARNGYHRGIPRLIPDKYGDIYVEQETGLYYLTDWFEGKECQGDKFDHIFRAAKYLAEFHGAARELNPVPSSAPRERWEDLPRQMAGYLQNINNSVAHLPEEFHEAWRTFESMAHRAQDLFRLSGFKKLVEKAKKEKTFCHRQFSPHNILFDHGQVNILHWEHCAYGVQVGDLVYFMRKTMPRFDWNFMVAKQILEGYDQIKPLSQEELFSLGAGLMFPVSFVKFGEKVRAGKREKAKISEKLKKLTELEQKKAAFLGKFFIYYCLKGFYPEESSNLFSQAWYIAEPKDVKGYMKNGATSISCFLALSFTVDPQGGVEDQFDLQLCKLSQECKAPIIPVLSGTNALAQPQVRERLTGEIEKIMEIYNFPGVDIDFELSSREQEKNFYRFVEELGQRLKQKGKLLLVSVPAAKGQELYYDYERLAGLSDYVLVKILDENVSFPGPIASTGYLRAALTYAQAQIPRGKIIAVLPVYGSRWVMGKNTREILSCREVEKLLDGKKEKLEWDFPSGTMWAGVVVDGEDHQIWMENADAFREKLFLAKKFSPAGYAFWRLGWEDRRIWRREPVEYLGREESFDYEGEDDGD